MKEFQLRFGQKHLPITSIYPLLSTTVLCLPQPFCCSGCLWCLQEPSACSGMIFPLASWKIRKILLAESALWWIRYHDHESLGYAVGSWVRLAAEDRPTDNESVKWRYWGNLTRLLWEWNKWHQESGMCLERLWQEMTPMLTQLLELGFSVSIRVLCRQEQ